jgi:hypothetical protein
VRIWLFKVLTESNFGRFTSFTSLVLPIRIAVSSVGRFTAQVCRHASRQTRFTAFLSTARFKSLFGTAIIKALGANLLGTAESAKYDDFNAFRFVFLTGRPLGFATLAGFTGIDGLSNGKASPLVQ